MHQYLATNQLHCHNRTTMSFTPQAQGKIFLFETFLLLNISSHVYLQPGAGFEAAADLQPLVLIPQSPET